LSYTTTTAKEEPKTNILLYLVAMNNIMLIEIKNHHNSNMVTLQNQVLFILYTTLQTWKGYSHTKEDLHPAINGNMYKIKFK
jgi:hypothetical protein